MCLSASEYVYVKVVDSTTHHFCQLIEGHVVVSDVGVGAEYGVLAVPRSNGTGFRTTLQLPIEGGGGGRSRGCVSDRSRGCGAVIGRVGGGGK